VQAMPPTPAVIDAPIRPGSRQYHGSATHAKMTSAGEGPSRAPEQPIAAAAPGTTRPERRPVRACPPPPQRKPAGASSEERKASGNAGHRSREGGCAPAAMHAGRGPRGSRGTEKEQDVERPAVLSRWRGPRPGRPPSSLRQRPAMKQEGVERRLSGQRRRQAKIVAGVKQIDRSVNTVRRQNPKNRKGGREVAVAGQTSRTLLFARLGSPQAPPPRAARSKRSGGNQEEQEQVPKRVDPLRNRMHRDEADPPSGTGNSEPASRAGRRRALRGASAQAAASFI
jgi:hypothetical protein